MSFIPCHISQWVALFCRHLRIDWPSAGRTELAPEIPVQPSTACIYISGGILLHLMLWLMCLTVGAKSTHIASLPSCALSGDSILTIDVGCTWIEFYWYTPYITLVALHHLWRSGEWGARENSRCDALASLVNGLKALYLLLYNIPKISSFVSFFVYSLLKYSLWRRDFPAEYESCSAYEAL